MKEFKPKEFVTTSTYKRKSISCVCGKELNVDYDDGKLTNATWCVECNRYYELYELKKKEFSYIITNYKCFECGAICKELFNGFGNYGEPKKVCKSCLQKQIKADRKLKEESSKRLKVLLESYIYNPEGL
jgi:hypothetical protein